MTVISLEPVICDAWHCRGVGPFNGGNCRYCRRDVAVPPPERRRPPVCVYCAMDRGLAPAIEIEPT